MGSWKLWRQGGGAVCGSCAVLLCVSGAWTRLHRHPVTVHVSLGARTARRALLLNQTATGWAAARAAGASTCVPAGLREDRHWPPVRPSL